MKIILLFLIYTLNAHAENLNTALNTVGYKNDPLNNGLMLKNIQRKGLKKTFTTIKFELEKNIYELEVISPSLEKEYEHERKNIIGVILKSYTDQPTPYQGEITNITKCSDYFKPKVKESILIGSKSISLIESFVGKDFNYGICEKNLIKYSSCSSFYYDQDKSQILKLKVITSPSKSCEKMSVGFFKNLHNA
ncbi:MAG: hypothetical protein H7281_02760 [Bacteriovorax sp.]|nr:hypothetical protein [Bacteriovorax sp.]